eukprot:5705053-Alexandrium_andersonii.AAC.1
MRSAECALRSRLHFGARMADCVSQMAGCGGFWAAECSFQVAFCNGAECGVHSELRIAADAALQSA